MKVSKYRSRKREERKERGSIYSQATKGAAKEETGCYTTNKFSADL